jgi:WD repeat-containing protein 19
VVKKAEGLPERDTLSRLVQDFLLGEIDGKIKDPKYSYKLFMAVGDYIQAPITAISIASAEQKDGQYQNAHDILFSMHQELAARKLQIPSELRYTTIYCLTALSID